MLYELKVDNTGDGVEDISYQFRFRTETRNPDTFLFNTGSINTLSDTDWNRPQYYSVTRVDDKDKGTMLASNLPTPPVNIGPRSTPNYGSLMVAAVSDLPGGGKVYAGQTDDPFFRRSRLGVRSRRPEAVRQPARDSARSRGRSRRSRRLQHARFAIQIPIAQLTKDRAVPTDPTDPDAVWTCGRSAARST